MQFLYKLSFKAGILHTLKNAFKLIADMTNTVLKKMVIYFALSLSDKQNKLIDTYYN
jgi:hypothetical protein